MDYISESPEETIQLGIQLSQTLKKNSILCFFGDLAAGKTTFIKGVAAGVANCAQDEVNSPTFVYLNIYGDEMKVYHFDLYRMKSAAEFLGMGFDDYLFSDGVSCIEWSERINELLPPHCIRIMMTHLGEGKRQITITTPASND